MIAALACALIDRYMEIMELVINSYYEKVRAGSKIGFRHQKNINIINMQMLCNFKSMIR